MSSENPIPHDQVPIDSTPESEGLAGEDLKESSRARFMYCNDVKLHSSGVWRYYRNKSLQQDDPKGACGTDFLSIKYDKTDRLDALGHCKNGKEKFKISW